MSAYDEPSPYLPPAMHRVGQCPQEAEDEAWRAKAQEEVRGHLVEARKLCQRARRGASHRWSDTYRKIGQALEELALAAADDRGEL